MFNSNNKNLDFAISLRRNPSDAAKLQTEFDKKRLARFEKAIATRPVFIPLYYSLAAAGQISAFEQMTPAGLNFDVILTNLISDFAVDRNIYFRESSRDIPLAYVGEGADLYLKLSDLSGGNSNAVNGQKTPFAWPCPYILDTRNRLAVGVYKTDVTADPEYLQIVLAGYRVSKNFELDNEQLKEIQDALNRRRNPRLVFIKQTINFESAGVGGKAVNVEFPQSDEPLLVRGARTDLEHSKIEINIEGEPKWTAAPCPVWSIAQKADNEQSNYLWFQRPVYLGARWSLEVTAENSIDGVHYDDQTGNYITWICETV